MTRHFLIDTDTASDDAVALIMAMRHPQVVLEAITVVAGNVPVQHGVQNAFYAVELCQQDIPVHRGIPCTAHAHEAFGWTREDFYHCNQSALAAAFIDKDGRAVLARTLADGYLAPAA